MEPRLRGGGQKSGNKRLRLQPNLGSDRTGSGTHGSETKGLEGQGRNTGNPRGAALQKRQAMGRGRTGRPGTTIRA